MSLSHQEKQERARQRRLKKRGVKLMTDEDYNDRVQATLNNLESAFNELVSENDPGFITVTRHNESTLTVDVRKIGTYTFSSDK